MIKGRYDLGDLDVVHDKIISKRNSDKYVVRVWPEFVWFRIDYSDWLLWAW